MNAAKLQRRTELYGPNRCLVRDAAKKKQLEDHVRQNFQEGNVHSNRTFQTTTAGNFKHEQVLPYHRVKPKNATYIYFGSEEQPQNSVMKSDFTGKPTSQSGYTTTSKGLGTNNLADFAPRYREESTIGHSLYKSDFDGEKSFAERQASKAAEGNMDGSKTRSTRKYHIGTHFELGNYFDSPASEASHSYRGDGDFANPDYLTNQADKNCSESCVFRAGDYNMAPPDPHEHFLSTQKKDYNIMHTGESSNKREDEDGHHGGTNFILGYDGREGNSVYRKDFNPNLLKNATRVPKALGLPCSKVMHEFPVVDSSTSVNRQDYVHHQLGAGRFESFGEIKKRQKKVSVELSSGGENEDRLRSEMAKSFCFPQSTDQIKPIIPVHKDYHHLESNRALPEDHPLLEQGCTEAQDNFLLPIKDEQEYARIKREGLKDRTARIKDSKCTHFVVGSDPLQRKTEQMAEFGAKKPLDPIVMAAGKPDLPTKGYSIISHDSGEIRGQAPRGLGDPQQLIQQRNYLKNINPRDTVNLNLRKAFLEYDKNLSGAISKDDLKLVCKDMEVNINDSDLDEIIARCDTKGDGLIDYHEFALNLTRLHPPCVALLQPPGEPMTTITRQDYKPPSNQKMRPEQLWVLEKDAKRFEPVETLPSSLMQWAAEPDYLQSINRKDYKEPDSVPFAV